MQGDGLTSSSTNSTDQDGQATADRRWQPGSPEEGAVADCCGAVSLHVVCIAEIADEGPHLGLGVHQMLDGHGSVWGQPSVSHHTQDHGIARSPHSRRGCKVELITHAQNGISALVVVQRVGQQILQHNMVEERGRVVEDGVGIDEVVGLGVAGDGV